MVFLEIIVKPKTMVKIKTKCLCDGLGEIIKGLCAGNLNFAQDIAFKIIYTAPTANPNIKDIIFKWTFLFWRYNGVFLWHYSVF